MFHLLPMFWEMNSHFLGCLLLLKSSAKLLLYQLVQDGLLLAPFCFSLLHPAFHYCIPTQLFSSLVNSENGKNCELQSTLTSQGSFSALCRMGPSLILDSDVILISVVWAIPKISHVTKKVFASVVILLIFISIYSGPCYIDVRQGHNKRNRCLWISMFYDSLAILSIFFRFNFLLLKSVDCWRQSEVFVTGEGAASS